MNRLMRPVEIDKIRFEMDNGVSFAQFPYWIVDKLGNLQIACPSEEIAIFIRDKVNSSSGDVNLNMLMIDAINAMRSKGLHSDDVEMEAVDPIEEAKTDGWYQEQLERSNLSRKKKKHYKRRKRIENK